VGQNEAALLYLLRDKSKMVDIPMKLISTCLRSYERRDLLVDAQIGLMLPLCPGHSSLFWVLARFRERTTLKSQHVKQLVKTIQESG